jgi:hypothetical protein
VTEILRRYFFPIAKLKKVKQMGKGVLRGHHVLKFPVKMQRHIFKKRRIINANHQCINALGCVGSGFENLYSIH